MIKDSVFRWLHVPVKKEFAPEEEESEDLSQKIQTTETLRTVPSARKKRTQQLTQNPFAGPPAKRPASAQQATVTDTPADSSQPVPELQPPSQASVPSSQPAPELQPPSQASVPSSQPAQPLPAAVQALANASE